MKRLSIVLVVTAIAATCLNKVASAEEGGGIPDEIVKELDGIVGSWKVEGKIGDKEHAGESMPRWERTDSLRG